MSKSKTPEAAAPLRPRTAEFVKRMLLGEPRGVVWSVLLIAAFALATALVWRHVRPQVAEKDEYRIGPKQIEVTTRPPWVKADVASDVVGGLTLDAPLSLLDDDLSKRLYDAFSAHPWVAKVERVAKSYPARVRVDLVYRRPVCMVEIAGSPRSSDGQVLPGELLPVDSHGVFLPAADFAPAQRLQYPRLADIATTPMGPPGSPWGDPRVTEGAEVAEVLREVWREFNLAYILPSKKPEPGPSGDEYTFELVTHGGSRIKWGRSPSTQMPAEVPAADKISRIKAHLGSKTSLDADGPQIIDVRGWHRLTSRPLRADELLR